MVQSGVQSKVYTTMVHSGTQWKMGTSNGAEWCPVKDLYSYSVQRYSVEDGYLQGQSESWAPLIAQSGSS